MIEDSATREPSWTVDCPPADECTAGFDDLAARVRLADEHLISASRTAALDVARDALLLLDTILGPLLLLDAAVLATVRFDALELMLVLPAGSFPLEGFLPFDFVAFAACDLEAAAFATFADFSL